eukprot:2297696-Amphidinium_carterae.1
MYSLVAEARTDPLAQAQSNAPRGSQGYPLPSDKLPCHTTTPNQAKSTKTIGNYSSFSERNTVATEMIAIALPQKNNNVTETEQEQKL